MKIRFIIAAALLASAPRPASAETLTNEQIVKLAAAGLGDQVLIAKIRASDSAFDTTTDGLLALRKKGVSNAVIAEMISAGGSGRKAPVAEPERVGLPRAAMSADSPDPRVPHPPGIYLLADWRSPTRMVAIEPTTSARTRNGNLVAYVLTGGLSRMSHTAVIPDAAANTATPRKRPIFYFYFGDGSGEGGRNFWSADAANSPDDFLLIRLRAKKQRREAVVGSSGIAGSNSGISEKERIPFTVSRIAPGVYQAQPEADLENGEYGFVYASLPAAAPGGGGQRVRVFDFSVDDGKPKKHK